MVTAFAQGNKGPLSPVSLVNNQKEISPCFEYKEQQDAMECWTGFVDRLCFENPELGPALSGSFQVKMVCGKCGKTEEHCERFTDIALDLSETGITTIETSLNAYFAEEVIEQCRCDNCDNIDNKVKQIWMKKLPDVLVFQMKRFLLTEKNCSYVEFPQELDMTKFLVPDYDKLEDKVFKLYSVVVHSGYSVNKGHYTAYIKAPDGEWYHFDDESVSVTTAEACYTAEHPYILFYERSFICPQPKPRRKKLHTQYKAAVRKWICKVKGWYPLICRFVSMVWFDIIPQYCDWFLEVKLEVKFLQEVYLLCRDIKYKLDGKSEEPTLSSHFSGEGSSEQANWKNSSEFVPPNNNNSQNHANTPVMLPVRYNSKSSLKVFSGGKIPQIPEIIIEDANEVYSEIDEEITEDNSYTSVSTASTEGKSDDVNSTPSDESTASIQERLQRSDTSSSSGGSGNESRGRSMERKRLTFKKVRYVDDDLSSSSSSGVYTDEGSSTSGISFNTSDGSVLDLLPQQSKSTTMSGNENNNNNITNKTTYSLKDKFSSVFSSVLKSGINMYNIYNGLVL